MTRASRSRNGTTYVYVLLLLSISRLAHHTETHQPIIGARWSNVDAHLDLLYL